MAQNSPTVRMVLYVVTVVVAVAAIALKPVSQAWSDAMGDVATYLAGISGMTAVSNISGPGTYKP